jgi:hypothetical protein
MMDSRILLFLLLPLASASAEFVIQVVEKDGTCCTRPPAAHGAGGDPNLCLQIPYHGFLNRSVAVKRSGRPMTSYDCTVSHKYKFVFPHIYKSGGSSLKNWFVSVLCDGIAKKRGNNHPSIKTACPWEILSTGTCMALSRFPDYFVFAFVRHPVNRTISQYSMMAHPNFLRSGGPAPSLEEFVHMPHVAGRQSRLNPGHYRNQKDFLFTRNGCPVVDFIGHLENYEADFRKVLNRLDSQDLWDGFEKYGFYGHRGEDPNIFGTHRKQENPESVRFTKELEQRLYERCPDDYRLFGFQKAIQ